jgi:hypothetical protein
MRFEINQGDVEALEKGEREWENWLDEIHGCQAVAKREE